jgi:4-hydroxy-3-polyprenylbenzoate decarboxylase
VRNAWSSPLDPRIPPQARAAGATSHSKMVIDACRPFAWKDSYPPAAALLPEEVAEIAGKWQHVLDPAR